MAGIGLSVLVLYGQVYWLRINLFLANLISIIAASIWNFFLNAQFGWNYGAGPVYRQWSIRTDRPVKTNYEAGPPRRAGEYPRFRTVRITSK